MPDFQIRNEGTVFTVLPLSDTAKEWLDENVQAEGWQWLGRALVIDQRFAAGLVQAILDNGLKVD